VLFLEFDMLGCVTINGSPLLKSFGEDSLWVFEPRLFLGEWAIWVSLFFL
jgi:hypothetical protein